MKQTGQQMCSLCAEQRTMGGFAFWLLGCRFVEFDSPGGSDSAAVVFLWMSHDRGSYERQGKAILFHMWSVLGSR